MTGRDISATAVTGDIINERTVTTFKREGEGYQLRDDVVSDASRFEATDTLKLSAGRDLASIGSTLKAGGNASIVAGRDVIIASQTEEDSYDYQRRRISGTESSVLQHASTVDVGGNLAIDARRDIAVIASTVSAAKDLSVTAGENLTLAAAADEQHDYSKGKKGKTKTTTQSDQVTQQSAELNAGGDLIAVAGTGTDALTGKISVNLSTWKGVAQFAASQGLKNGTSLALSKIMGQSGELGEALQSALFNTLAAASFNAVGDYTQGIYAEGSVQKVMIHAMVGGLLAKVSGGDFKTGALAAGANEVLVDQLNTWVGGDKELLNMSSQLVGLLAASTQNSATGESLKTGAWVAQNATQYNFLNHQEVVMLIKEARECSATKTCDQVRNKFADLNDANDKRLLDFCTSDPEGCRAAYQNFVAESNQTSELLSQARASSDIPESLKNAMGAVQLFNTNAKIFLVAGGVADGTAQAGVDIAAGLGFDVGPDKAASAAKWAAILLAGKGAKATASTGKVVATEATSANAQAALRAKLSGLQKAQETAAVTKTLPDGRIRYYTQEVPARTEGPTRGASFATEFDPKTGNTRQWMESYDKSGAVIRVHPKSINGQSVDAQHYPPTGAELKSWGQQ